jgi:mono/diheme cytochrome c family protein
MPDLSDPNKQMSADDIAALFANLATEDTTAEETAQIEEEIAAVEEVPPMPDLSDPNKVMSPDEIAALIANL